MSSEKNRTRNVRARNQRCGVSSSVGESEYTVVDDQEEMLSVRILPARPMNEEQEYADRDLLRPSSAHSLRSLPSVNAQILPRREIRHTTGPAVNRALKPGRRKNMIDKISVPVQPQEQRSPSRQQNATKNAGFSPRTLGRQIVETTSGHHTSHRHSLDLESHDIEIRSHQSLERVPSKRHHHEWPQTKDEFDQHHFVPHEKPQQTYCEEDWYVGACNRADAEHALHLVNKDGAFLVRDCSINTNSEPLVLAVYHEKRVYNVKIRCIESTCKYALGTGQRSNDMFDSVADIIKFHTIFPIILISGRNMPGNKYPENCVLTYAVTRRDIDQLLQ